MKRIAIALTGLFLSTICVPAAQAAEGNQEARQPAERQTYESPVLSLILLPVNVLIKMASLLGPDGAAKQAAPSSAPPADEAK